MVIDRPVAHLQYKYGNQCRCPALEGMSESPLLEYVKEDPIRIVHLMLVLTCVIIS